MPTIDSIDTIYKITVNGSDGYRTEVDWFVINITEPKPNIN